MSLLRTSLPALASLLALVAACSTPERASSGLAAQVPPPPPVEPAWTEAFHERALLVAERVRIEGPPGLLAHVATRPDPDVHERSERTTPDGFLQELRAKRSFPGSEIQAWLDGLEIAALRQLTVLERPGSCPVRVIAEGEVLWRSLESGSERRQPRLELVGEVGR